MSQSKMSLIFFSCCLLGGMGWILAPSQIAYMPVEMAVGYRFILSGLLTLGIAQIFRRDQKLNLKENYQAILVQGVFMFGLNYVFAYYALNYLFSGLVALILALLVIPNCLVESILFGKKFGLKKVLVSLIGLSGAILLFQGKALSGEHGFSIMGGALLAISMMCTAIGANFFNFYKKGSMDSIWSIGYAMLIGGVVALVASFGIHHHLVFPIEQGFLLPFFGLVVLSIGTFILYQILLAGRGAGFASYVWLITPAVALLLSWLFEGLTVGLYQILGMTCILFGGYLNLSMKENVNVKLQKNS